VHDSHKHVHSHLCSCLELVRIKAAQSKTPRFLQRSRGSATRFLQRSRGSATLAVWAQTSRTNWSGQRGGRKEALPGVRDADLDLTWKLERCQDLALPLALTWRAMCSSNSSCTESVRPVLVTVQQGKKKEGKHRPSAFRDLEDHLLRASWLSALWHRRNCSISAAASQGTCSLANSCCASELLRLRPRKYIVAQDMTAASVPKMPRRIVWATGLWGRVSGSSGPGGPS